MNIDVLKNNYEPMRTGERRVFKIDAFSTRSCGLKPTTENSNVITVTVIKEERPANNDGFESGMYFKVIGSGEDDSIELSCKPGKIHEVKFKGQAEIWSQGCNIPVILIQLCLNEAKIHQVKYPDNLTMRSLRAHDKIRRWALSKCKKIVMLDDLSKKRMGTIYLRGAILSNFDKGFILLSTGTYPPEGHACTKDLLGRYGNGDMATEENDKTIKVVDVWNAPWFFCRSKKKNRCILWNH